MSQMMVTARPMPCALHSNPPGSVPRRILVVDDDLLCRNGLQRSLRRAGFEVFQAGDGREALALLDGSGIELVITDLFMPRMDGLELILRLAQGSSPPRLIAVTGAFDAEGLLCSATERGADEILVKPFSEGELLACVRRLLDHAA